jgi:hypothetical protein
LSHIDQGLVFRIAAAVTLLCAGIPAAAQDDPPPPPEDIVCPAIEEDGLLCGSDPLRMTGNCTSFVAAADRLGALYRTELQKLPNSKDSLLTTSWWGCGPSSLSDVKKLLASIGSEPAAVVLSTQPYPSLPPLPPPPPPPPPADPLACIDLQNAVDRVLCAGTKLQAVRAYHQQAFARCKSVVTPGPLLDELETAESTFERQAPALCAADTAEAGESAKFQAFDSASCLVTAYQRRTRSMFDLHPECRPAD